MKGRSFLLKFATFAVIALLAARVYSATALAHHELSETPSQSTALRFGQSLALADFDGDDQVDRAMLTGTGRNKSLEIYLSHTNARAVLHFDTKTSERGSLYTRDIDSDGDNDLIWTDLLHPDDVVIWLDDGTGRFESVCPDKYAAEFVLTDSPTCSDSRNPHQDFALSPQRDPLPALSPARKTYHFNRAVSFAEKRPRLSIVAFPFHIPFDRGPPSLI
jgi:hypothetical protein